MATSSKPDKAHKDKQNKMTLMGKVLMRDTSKASRGDRKSKGSLKDYEMEEGDMNEKKRESLEGEKKRNSGEMNQVRTLMDKVRLRDRSEKFPKKDRNSKSRSKGEEFFTRDRSEKISRKERDSRAWSVDIDKLTLEGAAMADVATESGSHGNQEVRERSASAIGVGLQERSEAKNLVKQEHKDRSRKSSVVK